jgi:hypothetical protein
MIKWIADINWKHVFFIGVIYTIVATIVHQIEVFLTINYYTNPAYFGVWSKIMMPVAGPPPVSFFITSTTLTFVTGLSLAVVYYYVKNMLPKKFMQRVFFFADLLIGLSFIFFTLPTYLMFNVPIGLLLSWFISSFVILVTTAYTCVKIIK